MVSLEWPSTTLLVGETKCGNKPPQSQNNVSLSDTGKWESRSHANSRWINVGRAASLHQESRLCAFSGNRKEQSGDANEVEKMP